jgi:hypothetical protein
VRAVPPTPASEGGTGATEGGEGRRVAAFLADALAAVVLWFALLAPNRPDHLAPIGLVRIPIEGLAVVLLVLTLSRRTRRAAPVVAVVVGVPLGVLSVLKVLELGFFGVLDRPFNVVTDHGHLRSAAGVVVTSFGPVLGTGAVVGAVLLTMVLLLGVPLSVGRLARLVQRRPRASLIAVITLAVVWSAAAVSGSQVAPREPVAAADAVRLAVSEVRGTARALREQRMFDAAVGTDAYRAPGSADLAGLRGKDVLLVFVESYGRVAVEGPASATVQALLDAGSRQLHASGFEARSAYLTSPTFGGVSWLAHATLQSGVWVDNQWSYDRLLSGHRTSLTSAFARSGWRTVAVLPSNRGPWPQGQAYYGFDQIYDSSNLGYAGPGFGFSSMPDQYTLQAFQRLEVGHSRPAPLMAEIDLASSHGPWAPLPTMVGWDRLGDGSVFKDIHARAESAAALWTRRDRVPAAYMASIGYSLTALLSFIETYGNDNLVLILLGDHQPATIVSGLGASRDVPVTVVARDPKVIARISAWGWQHGLRPDTSAPVWRMDAFRDRFLAAYSGPTARVSAGEGR